MIDSLSQFVADLRRAGVRVSVAETADALQALRHLPLERREAVRLGLRSVLVKEQRHAVVFERLFAQHFSARAGSVSAGSGEESGAEESEGGSQGGAGSGAGQGEAAAPGAPRPDEAEADESRPGEQPGGKGEKAESENADAKNGDSEADTEVDTERADGEAGEDGENENAGAAELARLLESLRAGPDPSAQETSSAGAQNQAPESGGEDPHARTDLRRPLPPDTTDDLYEAIDALAERLATRQSRRYRAAKRGAVDLKRTVHSGLRRAGQPSTLKYRRRRIERRRLVVLCDISGSVYRVSRFFLKLVYQLQEQFGGTRSFVFVDRMVETTALFEDEPFGAALRRLEKDRQFNLFGRSDYGRALYQFYTDELPSLSRRTVLVVLGDARNNRFEPLEWVLEEAARRVHTLLWLNPDERRAWDRDDSVISTYAPYCTRVLECQNLRQLEEAGRLLLRG